MTFLEERRTVAQHQTVTPLLDQAGPLIKVPSNMSSGFGLENSLTLTEKGVHVLLEGLQVLFRGQFENFLRLS